MTQAPTPGPLTEAERYEKATRDFNRMRDDGSLPECDGCDASDRCMGVGNVCNPAAPVEASGSELGYEIGGVVQRLHDCLDGATKASVAVDTGDLKAALIAVEAQLNNLQRPFDNVVACEASDLRTIISNIRPQPSGETLWTEDMEWPESPLANDLYQHIQSQFCLHPDEAAEETGEVLSILAKHGVDPTNLPARAEAQDEGAAGEFETAEAMAEAWSDRVEIQHMVETTSAVFAKWASPEILSRFRQQMMAVIQQAYIEGVGARVEAISAAHPSPTPAADAACFECASDLWGPVCLNCNPEIKAVVERGFDQHGMAKILRDQLNDKSRRLNPSALKSTAAKEGGE